MSLNIPPTPGKRIAALREQRGWKQRRLTEEAGISTTFLSEIENDKRSMSFDVLLRIADALGTSLDYIVKGEVETQHRQPPLVIPSELAEAAEECGWSLGVTRDLLKARNIVVARRSRDLRTDNQEKILSKEDWIDLHKRLFGDDFIR